MLTTSPQRTTLRNAALAEPSIAQAITNGDDGAVAAWFNGIASPAYWVWRTNVTRKELYHSTSVDGTTWNWTTFKAQSQGEQGAWVQMFMGDQADFSLPNLRSAVANIFGAGNAQTTHILTVARRQATVAEKALATGAGTTAAPSVMGAEGAVTPGDVALILRG